MGRIIAFVPARGGSKSIPFKNIKNFCGRPLIFWVLQSLQGCLKIDEVVVATDSEEIIRTVSAFSFDKVTVYHRNPTNAQDSSSTESVMLEYLEQHELDDSDLFVLVQATSPFTKSDDFDKAIDKYFSDGYDSLLSCVRIKRFFWTETGNAKNYNYMFRPRRQDFNGELMENGAFYINTIAGVRQSKNRLCGNIGVFEMEEYTGVEIDEPHDWMIAETLMRKYNLSDLIERKWNIKLFLSDVDGVLTDAGMYYSENGDELKKFNTHDGMAFQLLREAGIKTGIITSEQTKLVERRGLKLKVDYLYQSKKHGGKLATALEICKKEGLTIDQVAYIGDDINCRELLREVGFAACPADAVDKIKQIPGILQLTKAGGNGAVREFVDLIMEQRACCSE